MSDPSTTPVRARLQRWAPRVVAAIAAIACLADQPPRWQMDAKIPTAAPAPAGKALRVSLEASHEPSLYVKSGGQQSTWEDRAIARTSWPGKAELFVDAGGSVESASIGDRCTSGGGMCSGCDPPPGAFVKILAIDEVDVWSVTATTTVAAGANPRIDLEIDTTREPRVVSVPSTDGSCSASFASSSPFAAPTAAGSGASSGALPPPGSLTTPEPSAPPPSAPGSSSGPPPSISPSTSPTPPPRPGARRLVISCWERGAATITATIRGACPSGPCAAPPGESVAFGRTARVP